MPRSSTSPTARPTSCGTTCGTPTTSVSAGHDLVPSAIFTHPQIAAVGATVKKDLRDRVLTTASAWSGYGDVAYGWAMEDETGFCKVLVDLADGYDPGRAHHGPPGPHPRPAARARGHARHHRPHAGRPALLDPPRSHRGRAASTSGNGLVSDGIRLRPMVHVTDMAAAVSF